MKQYRTIKGERVTLLDRYTRQIPDHGKGIDPKGNQILAKQDYALVMLAPQSPGHAPRYERMRRDTLEVIS